MSGIEVRSGTVAAARTGDQGAAVALSRSPTATQPPIFQGSAPAIITAAIGLRYPAVGQTPATASTCSSDPVVVHSFSAHSLPPQLPGRPSLGATSLANPFDYLVPQKLKDKICAREYVKFSTLL